MTSALPSLDSAPPVPALPSSTVLLLRDRAKGLEVLLVRRAASAVFGGMFVFPGGVVDAVDQGPLAEGALTGLGQGGDPWRAAGLRETAEEVGIYLTDQPVPTPTRPLKGAEVYRWVHSQDARFDAGRLRYLSNWITPHPAPQRFDARFYLARVAGHESLVLAEDELVEAVWVRPSQALDRLYRGVWEMILPTYKTLEDLQEFPTATAAWKSVGETQEVAPVVPRLVRRSGGLHALLPGDPGYEDAE